MKNKNSFTLLEMSITILLLGIISVGFISFNFSFMNKSNYELTREKITKIEKSLNEYILKNSYLPCPANINSTVNDSNFGIETRNFDNISCSLLERNNLYIGTIPVKTLNLPNEYSYDNWKSNIIYIVNKDYVNKTGFINGDNNIILKSLNNIEIKNSNPIYIILSTGENKNGAYRTAYFNTTNFDKNENLADYENINLDNIFITDIKTDDYDDILVYKNKYEVLFELNLENIPCNLSTLSTYGNEWKYSNHNLCPDSICSQNTEIPMNMDCAENYFSENTNEYNGYKRPLRKCLKYGYWSDILYPCIQGCGISNIKSITNGNFYENNIFYISEESIKRVKLNQKYIFRCYNGKVGYVTLNCNEDGEWQYISGSCINETNNINNYEFNKQCSQNAIAISNGSWNYPSEYIDNGSTITATCNTGYTLNGSYTATCNNGTWIYSGNGTCIETTSGKQSFSYTGSSQTFTVPAGVTELFVKVWGAQGGYNGGKGGYSYGKFSINSGENLYVYVGEEGKKGSFTSMQAGGWNGGGGANGNHNYSGTGGGATDIRYNGNALSNRIIVAGGGGGSAYGACCNNRYVNGGSGGGGNNNGNDGESVDPNRNGKGGTLTSGGAGGTGDGTGGSGSLGVGGNSVDMNGGNGGGGGGYYGGGGSANSWAGGAGGGGSGYIGGVTNGGGSNGVNEGNGKAIICWGNYATESSCN